MKASLILLGSICLLATTCLADGESDLRSASPAPSPERLDKRLPPVYPGQEVQVGAQKLRVWSSSGSVSGAQAPQVPQPGIVPESVIVDARGRGQRATTSPSAPAAPSVDSFAEDN
jgi:hypothetical protein